MIRRFIPKLFRLTSTLRQRIYPSLNRLILSCQGIKYGKNMKILTRISVIGGGNITIGNNFFFTSGEAINPISSNLRGAILTDNSKATIQIGDNVGMSSTRMWIHDRLTIGDNVNIGACVLIIDTDCHETDYRVRNHSLPPSTEEGQYVKSAPVTIEDDVWIGAHSIILKGVTIGARTIIGAGSVVTKSIPADCIAAGNPCRVIKYNGTGKQCATHTDGATP